MISSVNADPTATALASLRETYGGWPLEPPWGWAATFAFERRHGVVLPEPYRSFVAEVGAGGRFCGPPRYGLQKPDEGAPRRPGALARTFPLVARHEWQGGPANDPLAVDDGLLQLGTDGCDATWFLVVTGPARGTVWFIDDTAASPALRGSSGFADWVVDWKGGPKPFR